ncbi:hypothetical protein FVR03_22445 [Pontibacter qinzhouensis]|uniref:Cache domain-containing protein n=1 Tax=Pontibacter qinzhouensis TaxID=2603253 RepID=A0A5C8IR68_9BACT|nr:hypothetical protein [Pontibacter qinzhouensis]TXK23599.1 hypothetical protein FVR03_22445 [Pontibacter qinzhouensis]
MNNTPNPADRPAPVTPASAGQRLPQNRLVSALKRPIVFIPMLLLLCLLVLYFYKESQLKGIKAQAQADQQAVLDRANQRITENNTYLLQVMTKPFSWALRTAMLAGNQEQVDQYLFQFVQEKNFNLVLVADATGTIVSSTDQNFTGKAFANHFKQDYLKAEAALVDYANTERVVVVSPIMGFNTRLGTLLAVYLPGQQLGQQPPQTPAE